MMKHKHWFVMKMLTCNCFLNVFAQDNFHHSLFIFSFYLPATLRRQLSSNDAKLPSWMHQAAADHEELKKRALLIGGGSEPRVTTAFENCQFLNNSLTTNIVYPLLAQNGVVNVLSAFADVSMTNCLFRDNFYDLRRDGPVRCDIWNDNYKPKPTHFLFSTGLRVYGVRRIQRDTQYSKFMLY